MRSKAVAQAQVCSALHNSKLQIPLQALRMETTVFVWMYTFFKHVYIHLKHTLPFSIIYVPINHNSLGENKPMRQQTKTLKSRFKITALEHYKDKVFINSRRQAMQGKVMVHMGLYMLGMMQELFLLQRALTETSRYLEGEGICVAP